MNTGRRLGFKTDYFELGKGAAPIIVGILGYLTGRHIWRKYAKKKKIKEVEV